jgi:hypothetical protein
MAQSNVANRSVEASAKEEAKSGRDDDEADLVGARPRPHAKFSPVFDRAKNVSSEKLVCGTRDSLNRRPIHLPTK